MSILGRSGLDLYFPKESVELETGLDGLTRYILPEAIEFCCIVLFRIEF